MEQELETLKERVDQLEKQLSNVLALKESFLERLWWVEKSCGWHNSEDSPYTVETEV